MQIIIFLRSLCALWPILNHCICHSAGVKRPKHLNYRNSKTLNIRFSRPILKIIPEPLLDEKGSQKPQKSFDKCKAVCQ